MQNFKLIFALMIVGVIQMSNATTDPVIAESPELTKYFTADEIERGKNAGIAEHHLMDGAAYGFTVDEMIKIFPMRKFSRSNMTMEYMNNLCSILYPASQTFTNNTAYEKHVKGLIESVVRHLPDADVAAFLREMVCAYLSDPELYEKEADLFGLRFVPYMKVRFLKMKAQKGSSEQRTKLAKEMCCLYTDEDHSVFVLDRSSLKSLPDADLHEFGKQWAEFVGSNTVKSLDKLCDFIEAKNPTDQCDVGYPIKE